MNRSGYFDVNDSWAYVCWRGAVNSAIKGKRGQDFLQELADLMDEMPVKHLIAGVFGQGNTVCALGVVGQARGLDLENVFAKDVGYKQLADTLDIAPAMAREIMDLNDCHVEYETSAQRWVRMREWIDTQLEKDNAKIKK